MNAWFPRLTMHTLVIVISVLTYVLTTRIGEERRPPSIAIAWVLGLIAVPYLALPMYLFFGRRKLLRKPCPSGQPRKEVAALFGVSIRTVERIVAESIR